MSAFVPPNLGDTPAAIGTRDCVHIAVISCRLSTDGAQNYALSGDSVRVQPDGTARLIKIGEESHGVIDPFRFTVFNAGELVWVLLKPGSITHLQHVWSHPEITGDCPVVAPTPTPAPKSELETLFNELYYNDEYPEYDFERFVAALKHGCGGEEIESWREREVPPHVWRAYLQYIGADPSTPQHTDYFSCAC